MLAGGRSAINGASSFCSSQAVFWELWLCLWFWRKYSESSVPGETSQLSQPAQWSVASLMDLSADCLKSVNVAWDLEKCLLLVRVFSEWATTVYCSFLAVFPYFDCWGLSQITVDWNFSIYSRLKQAQPEYVPLLELIWGLRALASTVCMQGLMNTPSLPNGQCHLQWTFLHTVWNL